MLTGAWTGLTGAALIQSDIVHPAFGIAGLVLAPLFMIGAAEFVGPFEAEGWHPAGTLIPFAYIGWSLWLLALGVGLVVAA